MNKTKRMQSPYYEGAPATYREKVAFITTGPTRGQAPSLYEILLVEQVAGEVVGIDFTCFGNQGAHFFLKPHEAAAYRLSNRRHKVKWNGLPDVVKTAIIAYLERD